MRGSLITLALLPILAYAQSWCPPGATWIHDYADHAFSGWQGLTRVVYEGDTAVGGFTAQKLRETNVTAPWGSSNYSSFTYATPMITRYADDVVFVWDWNNAFDTLMWFSASPGQFWSGPGMDYELDGRLTVLDTSTVVIDGTPLRQLLIQRGNWDWVPPDTLRERIGFSFTYLNGWSWFLTDQPWTGLRCYQDAQIGYSAPGVPDCGFTLSVNEASIGISALVFPNPGTAHFTLSLLPGPHTITVFDAMGRMVLQQRTADARPVIGTEHLPEGLYRITVQDDQSGLMGATWVKER